MSFQRIFAKLACILAVVSASAAAVAAADWNAARDLKANEVLGSPTD